MLRKLVIGLSAVSLAFSATALAQQSASGGTAAEAKAMLERAAAAVRADKAKALDMSSRARAASGTATFIRSALASRTARSWRDLCHRQRH